MSEGKVVVVPPSQWGAKAGLLAGLETDSKGLVKRTAGNGTLYLRSDDRWNGLRYDKFRQEVTLRDCPDIPGIDKPRDGKVDDYCLVAIGHWLGVVHHLTLSERAVAAAVETAARSVGRAYHPVREWLEGLTWDGEPRVDTWLSSYMDAARGDAFVSSVGRMWLVSAVARVMSPGCQVDHMVILEGDQGTGKSSALRALTGDEWFADTRLNLDGGVDVYQSLRGKWIYEIGELDSFKGRDVTRIKAFVSSRIDTFRKSYGRSVEDYPRQVVFAGSTNETHYLTDPTGNRRYWPVKCCISGRKIDADRLARDREQIWAEAFQYYIDGCPWHITDDQMVEKAKSAQKQREQVDPWEELLAEWMKAPLVVARLARGMTASEVLLEGLSVPRKDQEHRDAIRVGVVLRKLGLETRGDTRPRKYFLETPDEAFPF